jgi:hypothetical protein
MANYDTSEQTHDPRLLAWNNEQAEHSLEELGSIDIGEADCDLLNAIIGNIDSARLAAINAQDINLDEFNIDNIDVDCLRADICLFPEQSVNQQQPQSRPQEEQNPYDKVGSTQTDLSIDDTRLKDARFAALSRNRQHVQTLPHQYNEPQTPQSFLSQLCEPLLVLQHHTQTQALWMQPESQPQSQQQGQLLQPVPAHLTAPQAQLPSSAQVPTQAKHAIVATAPQSMEYANIAQVQQSAATRVIHHNYHPLAKDDSFPHDQAARTAYIRQLYDAFTDITQCLDSATVTNFDTRWTTLSSGTSPYTPSMITTICHALLSIAINLHTHGPISLGIFDKAKLKNVYKYRHLTFSDRIAKVCELMRMSKARCGNLLKFEGLEMVVATAPLLVRQTGSNYHHNRRRQDHLVAGKDQLVAGVKRDAGEMQDGDDENEDWEG